MIYKILGTLDISLLTISNYRMISSAINEKITSHKKERIIFFVKNKSKLYEKIFLISKIILFDRREH